MVGEFDSAFRTLTMSVWIEGGVRCFSLTDVGNRFCDSFDGRAEPGDDCCQQPNVGVGMVARDFMQVFNRVGRWELN